MSYKNYELATRENENNFAIICKDEITNDLVKEVSLTLDLKISKIHFEYKKYNKLRKFHCKVNFLTKLL